MKVSKSIHTVAFGLATVLLLHLPKASNAGGETGGGVPRPAYEWKIFTLPLLDESVEKPLWPAGIEFSYSESRQSQGARPDRVSAQLTARIHQLFNTLKIDSADTVFYYDRPVMENGQTVPTDYNQYLEVYRSLMDSENRETKKLHPTLRHKIKKTLQVSYPIENVTTIEGCRISEIESAQLVFSTPKGEISFSRKGAISETKIAPDLCPQEIEKFQGNQENKELL